MNDKQFDALATGTNVLLKAWDHENNKIVETVATYLGWCDHPDWGLAVTISYENKDCHFDDERVEGQKETKTDIPVSQFQQNVILVMEVA